MNVFHDAIMSFLSMASHALIETHQEGLKALAKAS